ARLRGCSGSTRADRYGAVGGHRCTAPRSGVSLSKSTPATTSVVIKRLTGADLAATRSFLLKECFVPGQGFWSQYADHGTVSCTTTAICAYALAETGPLTKP